ncbi:DUF4192 domain-containing protein [Nocardioides aquiterrae]|uniref:DUF4192 domain-containing protein n=1 Tax=Nocardioides aquiterrae TaxID=203799 RepID=A0ABN1UIJ6_9ACTN
MTTLSFTARTPEDVLALVPVLLGFVPHDSVAMLTFGAGQPFHARLDLPTDPDELPAAVDQLLAPARQHRVRCVLFVLYTDDAALALVAARELGDAFTGAGIEVLEPIRADGARWWPAVGAWDGVPPEGVAYDLATHPFSAEAVLDGRVLHGSREELRATLHADARLVTGVVGALVEVADDPPEPAWVEALVTRHARDGTVPTDREVARLLRGLLDGEVRDAATAGLSRATAREHVGFWTDVVRRSPEPLLPGAAALLALAAWQAGHGALAWCALDRCAEVDEHHPLAGLVAQVLTRALPPQVWDEIRW